VAVLAVLLALGAGQGCSERGGAGSEAGAIQGFRAVQLGAADAGTEVALAPDEVLVISLDARPSTGHSWYVAAVDGQVLTLADTGLEAAPGMGGTDLEVLYFLGVNAGATELVLHYGRRWERTPARVFRVRVVVAGPAAGVLRPARPARAVASSSSALPARYDLCARGACTPVKDQGGCGSCWAFATAGVVEAAIALADGVTRDLSEQYLVSCNPHGYSCAGGWAVFDLFQDTVPAGEPAAGAVYEAEAPYLGADATCGGPHPHHERLLRWGTAYNDVLSLKQALLDHGALWVTICADGPFAAYTGGVFEGSGCTSINHAVTLVGWDDADGGAWILKNSWGAAWGEAGYMRIRYGANALGAIAFWADYQEPSDPAAGATPCSGLCADPVGFAGPSFTGVNLGTAARCYETTAPLVSGGCGNFAASRTLTVNGAPMPCTGAAWALPAPRNGGYCIQASAGDMPWAWFTVW
jgi:inhibitor of cysteine peptidase